MDQQWFEMPEARRRQLSRAVWIPLRASQTIDEEGKWGCVGYRTETYCVGSLAIPAEQRAAARTFELSDLSHSNCGGMIDDRYVPADHFHGYPGIPGAVVLVLSQEGNGLESNEWHLHQDFALTLALKREGDAWLAMDEGYVEVARLRREGGSPALLEVRAEYLKDYLCARRMSLVLCSFRERDAILKDASHIAWEEIEQVNDGARWRGQKQTVVEGGDPWGSSVAVFHVGRDNIDTTEDVPIISPSDANTVWSDRTFSRIGQKLFRVVGTLRRNEWIEPGEFSIRVRGDWCPSPHSFITDSAGIRTNADNLTEMGGWLWFRPALISTLLTQRGADLRWYTRDTGGIRPSPAVAYKHFGINSSGLVNIFGEDIGRLPHWIQAICLGFNVGPEGGVSKELLLAQAGGTPARSHAPEAFLPRAFEILNATAKRKFGSSLFRQHDQFEDLLRIAHRFRSSDRHTFLSLAKDLARLTADMIDTTMLQTVARPPSGEKWGSLKSLERVVANKRGPDAARELMSPLFAIYELRLADAHPQTADLRKSMKLAGVDERTAFVFQGYQLLHSCVCMLYALNEVLTEFPDL